MHDQPVTTMITSECLEAKGYRKHPSSEVIFPYSDYFYQRKVTDRLGICYFIEMVHYPKDDNDAFPMDESWMCNLNIDDPHCRFQQHRVEDLTMAEHRCSQVWEILGSPYYERSNE